MWWGDYHVHTVFSDGKNTPEEMAERAYELGLTELGFSDHGYAVRDVACCIPRERMGEYRERIGALKEAYRGRLNILCGIERDYTCSEDYGPFDYVIGSVHYMAMGDELVSVDWKGEILREAAQKYFGGDLLSVAECYFETVGDVAEKTNCDIIGHFDLVDKHNEACALWDENDPRFRRAWQAAADRLLKTRLPFEINTGAISRGCRTLPYPAPEMLRYLADRGAEFLLTSDCHRTQHLCFGFEEARKLAGDVRLLKRPALRETCGIEGGL